MSQAKAQLDLSLLPCVCNAPATDPASIGISGGEIALSLSSNGELGTRTGPG